MKKWLILTGVLLPVFCLSQTSVITGRVIDEWGTPVAYASIVFTEGKRGTVSGPDGSFRLELKGAFSTTEILTCSHINYREVKQVVSPHGSMVFALQRYAADEGIVYTTFQPYLRSTIKNHDKDSVINPFTKNSHGEIEEEYTVFNKAERPASFSMCNCDNDKYALSRYMEKHIFYKDSLDTAMTDIENGAVTARFTVDAAGKVKNPFILVSLNKAADQAVMEAIDQMPLWKSPPLQNGRPVESLHQVTVYFNVAWRQAVQDK
ncbi:MAG: energy transducer TonB [Bacteroidetes bacterium]|nr:energy transducer TonB [Bacteroidota bacterium]